MELRLTPLLVLLRQALDQLADVDTMNIFEEPVDAVEVPEYYDIILQPMDIQTMRNKVSVNLGSHVVEAFACDTETTSRHLKKFREEDFLI